MKAGRSYNHLMWSKLIIFLVSATIVLLGLMANTGMAEQQIATEYFGSTMISFSPLVSYESLVITISGPGGKVFSRKFEEGGSPYIDILDQAGKQLPDGQYTYELRINPVVTPDVQEALAVAREFNDYSMVTELQRAGKLPYEPLVQTGYFSIAGGAFVQPYAETNVTASSSNSSRDREPYNVVADVVHYDDLITTGSLCVGFDCVNGESFGYDTIRLKEHNLRIKFMDTSYTSYFPTNDWQITANDSTDGGASYFGIDDIDNGTSPFRIEAGAPNNSLYVDDYGRVGFGTSTPVKELHVKDSDTPTLRMEQDSSGGWTPQTWDIAGNETNFFIRDATHGSNLTFRIQPGAPSNSLSIKSDGKIGVGTWSPSATLEIERTDGTAGILIEELSNIDEERYMLELKNNGPPKMVFSNSNNNFSWNVGMSLDKSFKISKFSNKKARWLTRFKLSPNGNLTIAGSLTQKSDVNAKENFASVNSCDILTRLEDLPISTWNYKSDNPQVRHLGPVAQDFFSAFGLGEDDRHIAPMDAAGVALVAVQGLQKQVLEKDQQIAELEKRISELEKIVDKLVQVNSGNDSLTLLTIEQ